MSTNTVTVQNEEDAFELVQKALDGNFESDVVEVGFSGWPKFEVTVKGDRYDSSVTTSLMRSLVELQSVLNRIYAEVLYGKTAKSLTDEERQAIEIVFHVKEGSSNVVADLSGFFTELGKSAMEKMTGRQVVTTVVGAAAIWGTTSSFGSYLAHQEKMLSEANRHSITNQLIANQPKLMQIQNERDSNYTNILKSVSDAEHVEIDGEKITKGELELIVKPERKSSELKRIDGLYLVSSLKRRTDKYRIEIIRQSDDRVFTCDLFKGHLSMSEMTSITNSFTTETAIKLNVVARVRGEVINSANIVGVQDMASGEAVGAE